METTRLYRMGHSPTPSNAQNKWILRRQGNLPSSSNKTNPTSELAHSDGCQVQLHSEHGAKNPNLMSDLEFTVEIRVHIQNIPGEQFPIHVLN